MTLVMDLERRHFARKAQSCSTDRRRRQDPAGAGNRPPWRGTYRTASACRTCPTKPCSGSRHHAIFPAVFLRGAEFMVEGRVGSPCLAPVVPPYPRQRKTLVAVVRIRIIPMRKRRPLGQGPLHPREEPLISPACATSCTTARHARSRYRVQGKASRGLSSTKHCGKCTVPGTSCMPAWSERSPNLQKIAAT